MDRTRTIIDRLPGYWNTQSGSIIRAIVDSMASELSHTDNQIDTLDAMIGIDGTYGDDLDRRWGALLNIPRRGFEDDVKYRNRLKMSIPSLTGGTASALQYAVAVALNTDRYPLQSDDGIRILDAWAYTGDCNEFSKGYGNAVCYIDVDIAPQLTQQVVDDVADAIKSAKALGVDVHILWRKNEYEITDMVQGSTDVGDDAILPTMIHTVNNDDSTVDGAEHAIIGTDDTELTMSAHEGVADEVQQFNHSPEESLLNGTQYTLNSLFCTNCKSGFDVIHISGQPDQIV